MGLNISSIRVFDQIRDPEIPKPFGISDMALFTRVQHLCTFNIVAPLIYHLFPNVWKTSYTISASIFIDVPYWPPRSMGKFISCVVAGPSQWFFHFDEETVIAWTHIGSVWWMFQNLPLPAAQEVIDTAAVWLLALPWRMMGFCTTKYRRFLLSASHNPWKHCVLRLRATSILIQERCSSFANIVFGRSHSPYESQRSTHCSRFDRVLSPLAALTHLTALVHVHKAGSSWSHHRHVTAVLSIPFMQPLYLNCSRV